MKLLEEKIIKEGRIYPGQVLKVGAFLNHQIDVPFMNKVAEEFYNLFKDEPITKILTIETSGIGIACLTANFFNVPVLYAKKSKGINIGDDVYTVQVTSYTHKNVSNVIIEKQFLGPDDVVLILDDFLANGCALEGLLDLVKMAGARAVGCGIVIEKAFQDGGTRLRKKGIRIESLARIKSMDVVEGIEFID
ncbi:MAG: xanthine phosphoribosyltransferase [Lachnospiraceae bacterium]|nr:xanthine phosphoribosyltransferase [Lachnospiraceae bacterium]